MAFSVKGKMTQRARSICTYAIVPVNKSSAAKTRLGHALSKRERVSLSQAMLSDVLDALRKTKGIRRILIVTRDINAARLGARNGARVLSEGHARGLNPAVRRGIRFAEREGVDQVLVVPADVPLAKSSNFRRILRMGRKAKVLIVPSYDLGGTNALLLRPPRIMPVSYGGDSFRRHCRLARERNLTIRILRFQSLGLDADTPLDLVRIRSASGNTRSQRFLRKRSAH
jgi:2-phospho-L-lactate guanylyltransferase